MSGESSSGSRASLESIALVQATGQISMVSSPSEEKMGKDLSRHAAGEKMLKFPRSLEQSASSKCILAARVSSEVMLI